MSDKNKSEEANKSTAVTVVLDAPELKAVPKSRAKQIRDTFLPMADMLEEFEEQFNEIMTSSEEGIDDALSKKARRLRLDIGKIRHKTENTRKEQKQEYLRAGQAIDGVANILKWAVTEKENKLLEIEQHAERKEAERKEALQRERVELLDPYVDDADERNLADMDEDVWDIYLASKKQAHEDKIKAEEEAERKRKEAEEEAQRKAKLRQERLEETKPYYGYWMNYWDIKWEDMDEEEYKHQLQEARMNAEAVERAEKLREERKHASGELFRFLPNDLDLGTIDDATFAEALAKAGEDQQKHKDEMAKKEKERQEAQKKAEAEEKARRQAEQKAKRLQMEKEERERKEQEKLSAGDKKRMEHLAGDMKQLIYAFQEQPFKAKTNKDKWAKIEKLLQEAIGITGK